MATIAVFVALGGTGYAASKINGKNIKNKSISGKKLKSRTITSSKVKKDAIGGAEAHESKFGKVPSAAFADSAGSATSAGSAGTATTANNANNVNGQTVLKFSKEVNYNTAAFQTVIDFGGVKFTASCPSNIAGNPRVKAFNTSGAAGSFQGSLVATNNNTTRTFFAAVPANWTSTQEVNVINEDLTNATLTGTAMFLNGKETTFVFAMQDFGLANAFTCHFWGHMISG